VEPASPYRPKVSRETRLLLTAAVLAIVVLWLLAQIRFDGVPVPASPIPAVLSQLGNTPRFDDLAGQLAKIQLRLQPTLLVVGASAGDPAAPRQVAIKLRDDLVVTLLPPGTTPALGDATLVARDAASGLAVARVAAAATMPHPLPWTPGRLDQPRYFFATGVALTGVSLRPVFVGSLYPVDSPLWNAPLWTVPAGTNLAPGTLLFTTDAALAGLVITHDRGVAIVPGTSLLTEADRLIKSPPGFGGTIGIGVQGLTPPIAAISGAQSGVVVTSVDDDGLPADELRAGDVIEAIGGQAVPSRQHWDARVARLAPGETLVLRVRRGGALRDVKVVAAAPETPTDSGQLGLTLRERARVGAVVVGVVPGSAAERAGLAAGDVITLVADIAAPSPAQVMRAFASASEGQPVMIAVTRGTAHFVTTFAR
jgi:hypothetical protein